MTYDDDDDEEERTVVTSSADLQRELQQRLLRNSAALIVLTGSRTGETHKLPQGETVIGRSPRAGLRIGDDSISRMHAKVTVEGNQFTIEDLNSSNGTYLNHQRLVGCQPLQNGDKVRVGENTIIKFALQDSIDDAFQKQMYDAALRDGLTKAYNKRFLLDHLNKELRYAIRHGTYVCLLMLDLDHFKQVNDTYGHLAGDAVLQQMSRLALDLMRTEDVFARYGGEEFAVVVRGITLDQAAILGERLRRAVESHVFDTGQEHLRMTVSVGAAIVSAHAQDATTMIAAADHALYEAKRGGRNRVCVSR